jgi:RIO kinase 2
VKNLRDYHKHRAHCNWLYLSRLAALKEIAFMRALHDNGFPVPTPIDQNRHVVVMSLIKGSILNKVPSLEDPGKVFARIMDVMIRLARCGLVHCDFNEFNMFIDDDDRITIIDFPQMVSVDHPNAAMLFDRDTQCLRVFFERRFGFIASAVPSITIDCADRLESLDNAVKASGFDNEHQRRLEQGMAILGVDMAKKRENEACGVARHDSDSEGDEGGNDSHQEALAGVAAGGTAHELQEQACQAAGEDSGVSSASDAGSGLETDDSVEDPPSAEFAGSLLLMWAFEYCNPITQA